MEQERRWAGFLRSLGSPSADQGRRRGGSWSEGGSAVAADSKADFEGRQLEIYEDWRDEPW